MKQPRTKLNKKIAPLALILLILALALLGAKLIAGKRPLYVLGTTAFFVASASMEPEYPTYSFVIVKNRPFSQIEVGDVIVYQADALGGKMAFHRVVRIDERGIYTKGDNSTREDNQLITEQAYVGTGVYKISFLSGYFKILSQPKGFFAFFILPAAALLMLFSSLKLFKKSKGDAAV